MFLHHVNNVEHNIKKYLHWQRDNPSYSSMTLYIKTATLKNDTFSEVTISSKGKYFLKSIPEDEVSQFYFLYYRS